MKVDIDVREITGASWTFSSQPDSTLQNFRRQVQDRFGARVRLLFEVRRGHVSVSTLCLCIAEDAVSHL